MTPTELRIRLRQTGYDPLPVLGKRPAPSKWEALTAVRIADIEGWSRTFPQAENTGILTRLTPTLDIDIQVADAAEAIEDLVRERFLDYGDILVRLGMVPKRAIPFRTIEPFRKIVRQLIAPDGGTQRIELLGDGQQVVVFGTHPTTQKPYVWGGREPGDVAHGDLPFIDVGGARTFVDEAAQLLIDHFGFREPGAPSRCAPPSRRPEGNGQTDNRYARAALERETAELARVVSNRNDALNIAAMKLFEFVAAGALEAGEVEQALIDACTTNGLIADDGIRTVRATINSGASKGLKQPREMPPPQTKRGHVDQSPRPPDVAVVVNPTELFDPWQRYIVPAFPLDILPQTVKRYVSTQAQIIGCETGALAMAALATLSGAIDHRFAVKVMRYGDWWASPRLWVLLVGDSSVKKTPIIKAAADYLNELQSAEWVRYKNDKQAYVNAGGDADKFEGKEPPRYIAYDVTVEKLGIILGDQDRGLLIRRDELAGWICQMEKYATGRASGADRAFWLQAFDGGAYTVDRVSRNDLRISNLSCSILGGIQPARLAEVSNLTSDGLLQRFLPVMIGGSAFPVDHDTTGESREYKTLLKRLLAQSPQSLLLADDAAPVMEQLRRHLFDIEQASGGLADGFQSFIGKLPGIAATLALILMVSSDRDLPPGTEMPKSIIEDADTLIREFVLPHAVAFYCEGAWSESMQRLASSILTSDKDRIVPSDLTVNVRDFRNLSLWDVNQRISPLVAGGWLIPNDRGPQHRSWTVSPNVPSQFAERAELERRRKAKVHRLLHDLKAPAGCKS